MQIADPFIVDLADAESVAEHLDVARSQLAAAEAIVAQWRARTDLLEMVHQVFQGVPPLPADQRDPNADGRVDLRDIRTDAPPIPGPDNPFVALSREQSPPSGQLRDFGTAADGGRDFRPLGEREIGDLVVDLVTNEDRPMRSLDVHTMLNAMGYEFEPNQVSNALHYAAVRANPPRLQKGAKRGMYAPRGFSGSGFLADTDVSADQTSGTERIGRIAPQ